MVKQSGFNFKIYSKTIKDFIPDIDEHDLCYMSNKAARLYRKCESHGCVDNFRISRIDAENKYSKLYEKAIEDGCCGSIDRQYKNEVTGNRFIIGFNFGH